MRILVTGSDGMMGWGIKKVFVNDDLILTNKTTLDVTNIENVMAYVDYKPEIVFHLAAETNHERAQQNIEHTYMVNHTGTANIERLTSTLKIPLLYIGTCGMFDGRKEVYFEKDKPQPLNHYSRSKYYGEMQIRKNMFRYYIVRSGWAMGGGPDIDKKFINKIYQQIKSGQKEIFAISDVYGSPTYTLDFAKKLSFLVRNNDYGIFHVANSGVASRYDVAKAFVEYLGVDVKVIPLTYDQYYSTRPLKVPYTKREIVGSRAVYNMRKWQEALKEYTEECFKCA